jgi:hypothetical protein
MADDIEHKPSPDVGYCKPPKHTQFVKGKSGNPKGRPKGAKNHDTMVADEIYAQIPITEYGKRKKITKGQAVLKQVFNKGVVGDPKALPLALNEMRLHANRRGEPDQSQAASQEDDMVMKSIITRILQSARDAPFDAPPVGRIELRLSPIGTADE